MADLHLVILAAGKGTRMKSALPKVLHPVGGAPMIDHVHRHCRTLHAASVTVVIGHQGERSSGAPAHQGLTFVVQEPQLGTAHALLTAESALRHATGTVMLLSGDVPLLAVDTLKRCLSAQLDGRCAVTVLTADVTTPRATAASSDPARRLHVSSRNVTPRRANGDRERSTPASTPSTSKVSLTRCGRSRRTTRKVSTTCRTWSRIYRQARACCRNLIVD